MTAQTETAIDGLLGPDDPAPVEIVNGDSDHPVLLVCEHAGQAVPAALGDLGLPAGEIDRHIGWDIGAEGVTRRMAAILGCPCVIQRYSRLVIDCNRPPEAPDSMPEVSDGTAVPANRGLADRDRMVRVRAIFEPFQRAVSDGLDHPSRRATFAIHSFTPRMNGVARPWDIGFLYRKDERTSAALADLTRSARPDLTIGMNQPYDVDDLSDWFVPRQAEPRGIPHSLIEIRNDHIDTAAGQDRWAALLAGILGRWLQGDLT
ncbi:MAG: N-formylglutamate amidohydrolase [Rhodobiaceae bacterium]|nr:N-formylglutamate amidohydrolase [Rhodobiaceae bacterium]